jgi:hypothetical protein
MAIRVRHALRLHLLAGIDLLDLLARQKNKRPQRLTAGVTTSYM